MRLGGLELDQKERSLYQSQLELLLSYIDRLSQQDVAGVMPMTHAFLSENTWREDLPEESLPKEVALSLAPQARDDQVVVPKVIE